MDGHWPYLPLLFVPSPLDWASHVYFLLIALVLLLRGLMPVSPHWYVRLLREFLLVAPAVLFYFAVRGLVDAREAVAFGNARQVIDLERALNIYWEPGLQGLIIGSDLLVNIVNWIYIWAHWPVLIATLLWLVVARHDRYATYRNAVLLSGAIGILIFAVYPVAPPRLMPDVELLDTVTLRSQSYRVLQPPALANPHAAMPSLHFGWNLIVSIAVVRESRTLVGRLLGYTMPAAMFVGVVFTANHYILDAVVGGALVLVSMSLVQNAGRVTDGLARQLNQFSVAYQRMGFMPQAMGWSEIDPVAEPNGNGRRSGAFASHVARPITVAHRAGNSLRRALDAERDGIDLIEADVWLHKGRLEVRHSKTLGPVPVRWDRWSLEGTATPSLELAVLLDALEPRTQILYDIKGGNPELPGRLVDTVRQHRPGSPILVCSQNWRLLERFREFPEVTLVHSIGSRRQRRAAWTRLERDDHDAVSIHARLLNTETVRQLKQRVSFVITWPVNSERLLQQVCSWGVDGVISDDDELLVRIVATRAGARRQYELTPATTDAPVRP